MTATTLHDIARAASAYRQVLRTGVQVLPRVVPGDMVDAVLRLIHEDIRRRGLSPSEMDGWDRASCPYPHLRFDPAVMRLWNHMAERLGIDGARTEAQFVYQFPTPPGWDDAPSHVDTPPPWANGRPYSRIVGVALTPWDAHRGSVRVWLPDGSTTVLGLEPGDVVILPPDLPHATAPNRSGGVRMGCYLRFLEPAPEHATMGHLGRVNG